MKRLMFVGAAVAILGGLSVIFLMRAPAAPAANATPGTPNAPRIVTKKVDPPTPFVSTPAEAPKKAPPKKVDPAPVTPAPAPASSTLASLRLETDVPGASVFI